MKRFTFTQCRLSVFLAIFSAISVCSPLSIIAAPKVELTLLGNDGKEVGAKENKAESGVRKNNPGRPTNAMSKETDPLGKMKSDHGESGDLTISDDKEWGRSQTEGNLFGGGEGTAHASVNSGYKVKFSKRDGGINVAAEATLIDAVAETGAVFEGEWGKSQGTATAEIVAKAYADGEISWKDGKGGVSGRTGVVAGVSAKVEGSYKTPSFLGIALVASGSGEAYAAVGAEASGELSWKNGKLTVGGKVAAAWGFGLGGGGNVTLDFSELIEDPGKQWDKVVGAIGDARDAIVGAAGSVSDFFDDLLNGDKKKTTSANTNVQSDTPPVGEGLGNIIDILNGIASDSPLPPSSLEQNPAPKLELPEGKDTGAPTPRTGGTSAGKPAGGRVPTLGSLWGN
jgi:hypothetical protein